MRNKNKAAPAGPGFFHRLSIRTQLMLFLCCISGLLLFLVWGLSCYLLQPLYNDYIHKNLDTQVNRIVSMMDTAIENGETLSSRDFWQLERNTEFWGKVSDAIADGKIQLTNCCLDISDTTLRYVTYAENLHPCLLHAGSGITLGGTVESTRDSAQIIRLRKRCFEEGSLFLVVESAPLGSRQMVVGRTTADGSYAVLMSTSIVRVGEAGVVLGRMLPVIGLIVFLLSTGAAWLFSLWFARPLVQLSAAARQMAHGNYDVKVDGGRSDEIGALAQEFNHMAGEVKRSAQLQRDLLANVSHDLRTPLTLIKGYAETVRDLTGDEKAKRDEQMNIIIDETDRLSALVNSVMELSKVSSGTERCEKVRFDMGQLCEEVADRYTAVCAQNGWTLQLDIPGDAPLDVQADPAMMERALHNLLGNAMHHIGPDGVFILRAKPEAGGGCRVEVEDHGEGIRADELPYLFDRYYRSRRDAGKAGTGLGLSITKAIFQQHGFRFGVESTVGKGSTFWFIMTPPPAALPEKHKKTQTS